ncbi:hypothetical protein [Aestuariibacter sp. A3R04]|uniref:hypothetical protein n=1 Tax=Aestuariibacter sp. A3R04 TaxID=2841571 RepID=UPI001C08409E|nr:hypothetical protein [Aestuariibacter sp. A3R04]MBU3023404.1 hypothetical protein [Aestuariibacter sp. A3R04]
MSFSHLLRTKLFWVACIFICLVAFLAAVTQKPDISPVEWQERESTWQASAFRFADLDNKQIEKLMKGSIWGAKQPTEQAIQDTAWSLKGIIVENGTFEAIIDLDSEAKEVTQDRFGRFAEGDSLPNGARLIAITKDYVEYELNGVTNRKRLYE